MKTKNQQKSLIAAVLFGLVAGGANIALAENEPADNEVSGASTLQLGSDGSPFIFTGFVSNSDQDWYRITNTARYTSIVVTFAFQGSGPDTCRLRILGSDGVTELFNQQTETGINPYQRSYTFSSPAKGAVYYIGCLGDSADGNKSYTLTIDPSPNLDLLRGIARFESIIEGYELKRAKFLVKIKQQNAKLKKTKDSAEIAKIKALIAKYKLNRSGLKVKVVKNQAILNDLKQQLLELEGTSR